MDYNKIILFILIIVISISCGSLSGGDNDSPTGLHEDAFYTTAKDWDLYRIPLIKPVQVISATGYEDSWDLEFPYEQIGSKKTVETSLVTVIDSMIIVYSEMTALHGEMTEAWFIIDTKKKKEQAFKNIESYQKGLSEVGINENPKLYEVNELYRQFKEEKKLPFRK